MDLFRPSNPRSRGAGHYRRPGTSASYCGRTVEAQPVTEADVTGVCQQCAKGEKRDRVAAEQTVADRDVNAPTLAQRAGVRYALVGTGRRVHYSNNDDTLCGREVTEYTDGLDDRRPELCARCITAAEHRAYAHALAADSPLAAAAVDLAETVEQADAQFEQAAHAADAVGHAEQVEAGVETVADAVALYDAYIATAEAAVEPARCTLHGDQCDHDPGTPHHFADLHIGPPVARTAPTICPEFVTLAPDDLIADEWRTAAALVTEAEATEGTWRGAWIGEQQADDVLFVVDGTAEQGALFAPEPRPGHEPIVARASFRPADLDRIKAKAAADREAYRAETDNRIAAECAAHGVAPSQGVRDRIAARAAEQAPARRVIEGVIVQHAGTAEGSTPSNASHPDVVAARAALDGLAVATMTDHHDVTEPTEDEQHVRGYLIDPRTHGRVAVYWLEGGRTVRRDQMPHGPALDCLADRLTRRGWAVEKMLRSSQCVFAHRPPTD
ncbi:hypothetical protein [Streptomyces sp. NPDC021969]|uniref:hypothetical protein n=1 Tax=unclassified Streptomyces TaxID=2593676 RepID=UPI0033CCBEAB